MTVTFDEVRALLEAEEPDYEAALRLGVGALPHLERLVESGDRNLGAKAAYLAGRLGDPTALPVLRAAATSRDPALRAAAAGGARHLADRDAESVLLPLLDDDSPGVRKTALTAVTDGTSALLIDRIAARGVVEPVESIRDAAARATDRLGRIRRGGPTE